MTNTHNQIQLSSGTKVGKITTAKTANVQHLAEIQILKNDQKSFKRLKYPEKLAEVDLRN